MNVPPTVGVLPFWGSSPSHGTGQAPGHTQECPWRASKPRVGSRHKPPVLQLCSPSAAVPLGAIQGP